MKYALLITAALYTVAPAAQATEDEFGARFTNETPIAFQDTSQTIDVFTIAPQDIEPAAGVESDEETLIQDVPQNVIDHPQNIFEDGKTR